MVLLLVVIQVGAANYPAVAGLSSGSSLKDRETLSREDEADREEDPEYEDDLADVDAADDDEEDPEYVEHEDDPAVLGRRRWWSTDWTTRKSSNWGPKNPEEEGCLRVILLTMRRGLLLVARVLESAVGNSVRFDSRRHLSSLSCRLSVCLCLDTEHVCLCV